MTSNRRAQSSAIQIKTYSRPNCPACGNVGKQIYRDLRDACFGAPGEWCFTKCEADDCRALWLNPAPVPEDLLYAYRNYHTHGETTDRIEGLLKRVYRNLVHAALWATGVLSERKRAERMFIDELPPGALLDVGCGRGEFLARMARHGWEVTGVDFDPEAVEVARNANGVDVHVGGLEVLDSTRRRFDAITSNHSLEHVYDPLEFLNACRRLLKPGGRLVIRTPNAESHGHRRYRSAWRGLEPPRHLCIPTMPAMRRLADQAGLSIIECSTSPAMAEGILLSSHFIENYGGMDAIPEGVRGLLNKMLGPVLAIQAQVQWRLNSASGEELCVVLCRNER